MSDLVSTVHTNYELGFTSPHATPEVEYSDMGFADPEAIIIDNPFDSSHSYSYRNIGNQGFGDPYGNGNFYLEGNKTKFSDDGGEIAILRGRFGDLLRNTPENRPIGPFQIDFISVATGDEYTAYSGIPQNRRLLYTTINQDKMYVCLPIMPKGLYNIRILYGDGYVNQTQITSGIEIIHRNRFDRGLAARQNLPGFFNAGERSDNIVPSQDYKEESNLAVLTKAFGEICDYAFPNAYTVTTTPTLRGATTIDVETTLRLPESGSVYVGSELVTYTGKTNTSLTGCKGVRCDYPRNMKVEGKERDYAAIPNFILRRHDDLKKPKWAMLNTDWDGAFNVMHYGERSSTGVNFEYFYKLFRKVSPNSLATYDSLNRTLNFTDADFAKDVYTQKYCRIGGKTYHIESVDEANNSAVLTQYGTSYWHPAPRNTQVILGVETNIPTIYSVTVLPYWIRFDNNGLFRVEMDGSIFKEDLGFIDKDFIDLNIYLGDPDVSEGENALLRHLAAGVKGEVLRRDFYGDKWPLTIVEDIRDPLLIVEPARNLI